MDFPPEEWDIFPAEDFNVAVPRAPGACGVELLAQIRPNGQVLDHWRLALGGTEILEVVFDLRQLVKSGEAFPAIKMCYQQWPADIDIRRNMTAGPWLDLVELIRSNEIMVEDSEVAPGESPITNQDVLESLAAMPDKGQASLRWAVCVKEDGTLELQLQSLPASKNVLNGKPIFKRY